MFKIERPKISLKRALKERLKDSCGPLGRRPPQVPGAMGRQTCGHSAVSNSSTRNGRSANTRPSRAGQPSGNDRPMLEASGSGTGRWVSS